MAVRRSSRLLLPALASDSVAIARQQWAIVVALLILAALFRLVQLSLKAPHFDEGINGHFVAETWRLGFYRYDPTNFHGPLYFYFLQFADLIFGSDIAGYRFLNGLAAVAVVGVIAAHARFFDQAALWAAAIFAVSPGAVFYSRYAIHEILFIFFQVLFSYGFWLYWAAETGRARRRAWIFMVASFFAMILIKETVIIFIVSWALAWFATEISLRIKPAALKISATRIKSRDILHPSDDFSVSEAIAIVMIGALCTVIIYGGFFYNPHGLIDMITAFSSWAKTGTSLTGHEKPYQYWLTLIARYEWPCLVALLSSVPLAVVGSPRARMMSIFSVGILAAYSLIPYKTPWCILNMIWPVAFVFGAAIERVCAAVADSKLRSSSQWFIRVASAALVCFSAYSAWSLNFINSMNLQEPYVYVQTTAQYKIVTDLINHASDVQPELRNVKLLVLNHDTWPLPFTLGSYPNLQWGKGAIADPQGFDVILIDAGDRARIEALVTKDYWRLPFKIRDSYDDGFAYLEKTLYRDFVQQYVFSTHSEASVVEIKRAEKPQ